MKLITFLLASAFAATAVASASANMQVNHRSGGWTNYSGTNNEGGYTCGMYIGTNDYVKTIHVKYFAASDTYEVQLYKSGWSIPENTNVAVEVGFDKNSFGGIPDAFGGGADGGLGLVGIHLGKGSVGDFIEDFAHADTMWIKFPNGSEDTWTTPMAGSRDASNIFKNCVALAPHPTQPFGKTQPFGAKTQPFGQPTKTNGGV